VTEYTISALEKGKAMEQMRSTTSKPIKTPGPDHPITIERNPNRVVISVAGRVIADTRDALTLRESTYPPVQYIPRKDVDLALLERTDHATYCPYKGDCGYFSIPVGGKPIRGRSRHQRLSRLLPRPRRRDRRTARRLARPGLGCAGPPAVVCPINAMTANRSLELSRWAG
jgi:uncharacterized protein (DUF427 family)